MSGSLRVARELPRGCARSAKISIDPARQTGWHNSIGSEASITLGTIMARAALAALAEIPALEARRSIALPPTTVSSCNGVIGLLAPRLIQDETMSPNPALLNFSMKPGSPPVCSLAISESNPERSGPARRG